MAQSFLMKDSRKIRIKNQALRKEHKASRVNNPNGTCSHIIGGRGKDQMTHASALQMARKSGSQPSERGFTSEACAHSSVFPIWDFTVNTHPFMGLPMYSFLSPIHNARDFRLWLSSQSQGLTLHCHCTLSLLRDTR